MSNKKQIKKAARNLENANTTKKTWKKLWERVRRIVSWPCKKIAQLLRKLWAWVCGLDLIGLLNSALLVAIIVLFSLLIIDLVGCKKQQVVIVSEPIQTVEKITPEKNANRVVLPLTNNTESQTQTINVVPVKVAEVTVAKKQTPKQNNELMGDIVIDSRGAGAILQKDYKVNGNLYLQNMRKYTLPCNVRINGNLFLRDVNMLQFCGEFVVTGNIYVSPRSAFGPLPKNARIGGHVVL